MAVVDRSPAVRAPPYEQGWPYLLDFEAGDTVEVRPALRVSGGRVSMGWSLAVGASASIAVEVRMVEGAPWVATPASPVTEDWSDYEDAPFHSLRFVQTGGAKSTLSVQSRWPLDQDEV